jgi:hypothetical protein
MLITEDLSQSFNPVPKPLKKVKMPKPMKKVGEKTTRWADVREELKAAFYKVGIINCEIKRKHCWHNTALGFAHLKKRRKLTKEDITKVVLGCNPCHLEIEILPAEEMERILQSIIDSRPVQPREVSLVK